MTAPLNIWLITVGEPLPVGPAARLLRTGLLAQALAARGHRVTWWTGSFDHSGKRFWPQSDLGTIHAGTPPFAIRFLRSTGYARNVSFARIADHRAAARSFQEQAASLPRPDAIVCALPTLELCAAAAAYGQAQGVPVALDVRDLWPDVFYGVLPAPLRPVMQLLTCPYARMARKALQSASAVLACSQAYLEWGLRHAQRAATPHDRVFALGTVAPPPPAAQALPASVQALLAQGKKLIVFSGLFGRSYDLQTPIEAARLMHAQGDTQALWVFAGSGEAQDVQRLHALAGGLPNVVFTGWVEAAALHALLSQAWLGLAAYAASALQSLPNKPFDYMSHGLPVASTLGGELAALVAQERIGWNLPAGDAPAMAALVQQLLADAPTQGPRHQEASQAAKTLFAARFDAATIYPQHAQWVEAFAAHFSKATP